MRDLVGQRFGWLTVIAFSHRDAKRNAHWHCQCDCGRETVVRGDHLQNGNTRSCRCLKSDGRTSQLIGEGQKRAWPRRKARELEEKLRRAVSRGVLTEEQAQSWIESRRKKLRDKPKPEPRPLGPKPPKSVVQREWDKILGVDAAVAALQKQSSLPSDRTSDECGRRAVQQKGN